jgi:Cd2+/Zn2+-exporting ATPase
MVLAVLICLIPGAITGDWSTWFYRALVLLVIACPCALVISTPVSVVSGLTAMARRGVLIKGGAYLEIVGKLRALAVDKTGTITRGLPEVTGVISLTDQSSEEIVKLAAAIDTHSDHPIAIAITDYAKAQNITFPSAADYQSQTGRGADGTLDGHQYFVGNHRYTHELGVCSEEIEARLHEVELKGLSVVVVGHKPHDGCPGDVLGIIAVGDTIRADAKAAIASLHTVGIEQVVMLSGDNLTTVNAIAKEAGIDQAKGDLLPEQKIENVRELLEKYEFVGMVGDGVNDAPAMASASLGIAMGAAGTDTAIETADLALMTDDLGKISEAIHLGRRALGIIKFNIVFALAIKTIFLVLAFTGHTSLWLAILADTGATLLVIANALRLLKIPKNHNT